MSTYRATVERDADGYWFVDFPDVPGCHTQGRTLRAARSRMRDALALWVDDADTAEIAETVALPQAARDAIQDSLVSRADAERHAQAARGATTRAARMLTAEGLPMRDTAELLGMSHQRVSQLVNG